MSQLDKTGNMQLSSKAKRMYVRGRSRLQRIEAARNDIGGSKEAKVQLELKQIINIKGMLTASLAAKGTNEANGPWLKVLGKLVAEDLKMPLSLSAFPKLCAQKHVQIGEIVLDGQLRVQLRNFNP